MDYDANHALSSKYEARFDISVSLVTLTGIEILMTHNIGDMKSVSLSILIISNEYRFAWTMMGRKVTYSNINSYSQTIITPYGSTTFIDVYSILNGIFIQTNQYSSIASLSYSFYYSIVLSGSAVRAYTLITNGSSASYINYVVMKLLFIKRDYIPYQ